MSERTFAFKVKPMDGGGGMRLMQPCCADCHGKWFLGR